MEINIARKIAWSFHRTTGVEFEELLSEACLAYCEAEVDPNYDPRKSAMTTFAYYKMHSHLKNYIKKQYHDEQVNDRAELTPEQEVEFKDTIESLTDEAKFVCEQILKSPHEFLSEGAPRKCQSKLKTYLRQSGFTWEQIRNSFKEIKNAINEPAQ